MQVHITKLIGEGGYAFIYAAKEVGSGKEYALKRFLVFEDSKVKETVQEIRLMKDLQCEEDFVKFSTAASTDHSVGKKLSKEFLLLMEHCSGGDLAQLLRRTGEPLQPGQVCQVVAPLVRALQVLHSRAPPVTHRDIKLENLLLTAAGAIKLCDLGSASTAVHNPNQDWSMNQRSQLEDELAKYSTPMYRAPEMLDTWANYPVGPAVDIWAAGLVLYTICFNKHPFDDSNKLAIVNGNYRLPGADCRYSMFHPLIRRMLTVDPRQRPTAAEVLDLLAAVAETHGFSTRGPLQLAVQPESIRPAPLPDGPTVAGLVSPVESQGVSFLKASAGSLLSRLKDKTSAVVATVQSSMASKDLDFHCITSRVAAMSFPAEGLESAYRNHMEDVRGMMEVQHSGHYAVYNVSERLYPASKFPSGQLVAAGWPAGTTPGLAATLELARAMLDFLSRDLRNVVVVHCLDGRASTAYTVCALLLYSGLAPSTEAALAVFTGRRCDPGLHPGQRAALDHLVCLLTAQPPVIKAPFVTVTSLVVEPVPLFNKAGEGCRPYCELWQGGERVASTLQDYTRMRSFSPLQGDEAVTLPVNMTVCGDITLAVYHARQQLGKLSPVRICQLQLHTSRLTPGRPSHSWPLLQLDCTAEPARYPDTFRLVLNCSTSQECSGLDWDWPDSSASQLLFNSEQDFEAVTRLLGTTTTAAPAATSNSSSKFFVNNPDLEHVPAVARPASPRPAPVDLLGLSVATPAPAPSAVPATPSSRPAPKSVENTFDFLGDLGKPGPAPPAVPSSSSDSLSDIFGSPGSSLSTPLLDATPMAASTAKPAQLPPTTVSFDPFSDLSSLGGSLSSASSVGVAQSRGGSRPAPAPAPAANYSRSLFENKQTGGVKPKVATNTFDDLLGGFNPTQSRNQNQSIGAMKKSELVSAMDPDEARIFEWKEGKARNIRTLLCSLHKIIWPGARWSDCGMHQLVSSADVKKMYRKACLAVHPDKQMGTDNENISKLIFMELNEAWSEFENDPNQQNMFG